MNEACLNAKWIGCDLTHEKAQKFTEQVLNHMRERLSDYQEQYGDLYNLEATPAESTSFRLAKHDLARYPDIITANQTGTPYYTNSSHLPVGYTDDIFAALDIQDNLQTLYTSGTVFHAFLGEKLPDWRSAANLVRKIAQNYKLPYYTLSPTYSVCKNHGYLVGEQKVCPICGEKTEVYSRITGYYRPVQNWNDGKAQEFKDRKVYEILQEVNNQPKNDYHTGESAVEESAKAEENQPCACENAGCGAQAKLVLCATKTCPKCTMVTVFLDKANLASEKVYVEEKEEFFRNNGITEAPTLLVFEGESVTKIANPSNIKKYIESLS